MRLPKTLLSSFMAATTFLFSACAVMHGSETSSDLDAGALVYRGTVVSTLEDGSIEVAQQPGYNYGQQSIVFRIDDNTKMDLANGSPNHNAFIEVHYNGILTRSLPPQGTAMYIKVIAPSTEGIVQNGTIQSVSKTDSGFRIELMPLGSQSENPQDTIILQVPGDALENIQPDDLIPGTKVSAITSGIATASLPPQMPVIVLMPYSDQ